MLRAWRGARRSLRREPPLDLRWTRACFCGQSVSGGGNVADFAMIGFPFLTGSEEERGPLYEQTGVAFEGRRNPLPVPGQGHKEGIPLSSDSVPKAVPLMQVRVADRLIVTLPGEPTAETGRRLRDSVLAAVRPAGISRVVVSGLANEFIQYFTTPQEYDRQHYEGGSTLYGPLSVPFLIDQQTEQARRLAAGQPSQDAYPFDPTNGVSPSGPSYGDGATSGVFDTQPRSTRRLGHVVIGWRGAPQGLDRPLERAFVTVERRQRRRWRRVTSDLGLAMLWHMDGENRYVAKWEIPLSAKLGTHRMVVRAKGYRLVSRRFRVRVSRSLSLRQVPASGGRLAVALDYPRARRDIDLTHRPGNATGGAVRFRVGKRTLLVRTKRRESFAVRAPRGRAVTALRARDRFGNVATKQLGLR
jgi:neutral ceramidase